MTTELVYEAITLIDDDLIDEAATYTPKKKKVIHWKRWTALAACFILVIGLGNFAARFLGGRGGSTGSSPNEGNGGAGADGSTFMSYAGPVFPLTSLDDTDGIAAEREITLDFAPWLPTWYSNEEHAAETIGQTDSKDYLDALDQYNEWYPEGGYYKTSDNIIVTDTYTLTNSTPEDKTISFLYPFVCSLMSLDEFLPDLTINGQPQNPDLVFGPYSGGFQGVLGADDPDGTANLDQLTSWADYKALLSDGSYLAQALGDPVDLTGINVIVYEFTDPNGPDETSDVPNPSIRVTFDMNYDNTTILSYGFHSGSYDRESGKMGQGFSIPERSSPNYGKPFYLIVLGDDIKNMEINGYVTGGWDTKKELEYFNVNTNRYETDLDTILRQAAYFIYDNTSWQYGDNIAIDFETYYTLFCDHLLSYGILAEDGGAERYDSGWLGELSEVGSVNRVCYLNASITIPAGESIAFSASMRKDASYDFYCASTENRNIKSYDLVAQLGSDLMFTSLTATLADHGQIEIIRQNFGFDLLSRSLTVNLDPSEEHYYLEVRRLSQES